MQIRGRYDSKPLQLSGNAVRPQHMERTLLCRAAVQPRPALASNKSRRDRRLAILVSQ